MAGGWNSLGPKSRAQLAQVGVTTLEALRARDPYEVYAAVKARWPGANRNLLYALMAAQEGSDWRVIARERRTEVLLRLEALGLAPR